MRIHSTILFFTLLTILLMSFQLIYSYQAFHLDKVVINVYEDGSTLVTYYISVDHYPENLTIKLLGEPIYIEAESGGVNIPVDVSGLNASLIALDSDVKLTYLTNVLTNKSGNEWTLHYFSESSSKVILPKTSLIYEVYPKNFNVSIINDTFAISLPQGEVTIKYVLIPTQPTGGGGNVVKPYIINPLYLVIGILGFAIIVGGYVIYSKRKTRMEIYKTLDERDRRILEILSKYGELTAKEIMEKSGIPKTPLYRRLNRLVESGFIESVRRSGSVYYRIKSGR